MDRNEVLTNNAYRFAEKYYELERDGKAGPQPPYIKELLAKGKDEFVDAMAKDFYAKMDSAYAPEGDKEYWNDARAGRLNETKDKDGVGWLMFKGPSPEQAFETKRFNEFFPLIKDGKWHGMPTKELESKMVDMGFDPNSKKSKMEFFDELGKHDVNYQKAKLADEFSHSASGIALALGAPNAYKEGMAQIVGDGPADRGKVWKQFGTDAGRNLVFGALAGSSRLAESPAALSLATGGTQFGSDLLSAQINPQFYQSNADYVVPAVGATAAMATVPNVVKGVASWMKQSTNPKVREFGKGMLRGAKGYDPSVDEKNAIKMALLEARHPKQKSVAGSTGVADDAQRTVEENVRRKLEALGFRDYPTLTPESDDFARIHLGNKGMGQPQTTFELMDPVYGLTDKQALKAIDQAYASDYGKNFVKLTPQLEKLYPEFAGPSREGAAQAMGLIRTETPARYNILSQGTKKTGPAQKTFDAFFGPSEGSKAGTAVGRTLSGVGGTVESATKVNPVSAVQQALTTGDIGSTLDPKTQDYLNQQWFVDFTGADEDMAAAYQKVLEERNKKKKGK